MKRFCTRIEFQDGENHGMRDGFALSNWREGTWEVENNLLCQRRDRLEELNGRLERTRRIYGVDMSWITIRRAPWPALVAGERDWADYEACAVVRVSAGGRAGLAVRWEDARHCYYLLLENGEAVALYRREHDSLSELARAPFAHDADAFYTLTVRADGDAFECRIDDTTVLTVKDDSFASGRVALVAECPAEYRSLHVKGTHHGVKKLSLAPDLVPREEASIPISSFDPEVEEHPQLYQLDGKPVIARRMKKSRRLTFHDTEGSEVLHVGPWPEGEGSGAAPLQIFDINGDGRDEIVIAADGHIRVFSGETGAELNSCEAPVPNPYGEAILTPEFASLDDALCPVRLNSGGAMGFYVKDRYWNIHLYDASLRHLWHRALNTGHFPLPLDIDGDGRDEIFCCHDLLDADGNILWSMDINDHIDAIGYFSLLEGGPRQLYMMAGEEGLLHVNPHSGEILSQQELGHVQGCIVGRFLENRPGRQLLVETCWREPSINYLLDEDLQEITRWENEPTLYSLPRVLLPWGDRDLGATGEGIQDPLTGMLLYEFRAEPFHTQWVTDWPRLGESRLVQVHTGRIAVYGPATGRIHYGFPIRPIHCGYLPQGPLAWRD